MHLQDEQRNAFKWTTESEEKVKKKVPKSEEMANKMTKSEEISRKKLLKSQGLCIVLLMYFCKTIITYYF